MFDANKTKDAIVLWIRDYFERNGKGCNAIIGISGGKDSTIVAALCVEALGRERVIGVLMPNGIQKDYSDSKAVVEYLGIKNLTINISLSVQEILGIMRCEGISPSDNTKYNLPARIRMSTLFAVSQSCNGRVANTSNLSEDWLGWATIFGDAAGQFSPLSKLTVTEVCAVGRTLGLPLYLVDKIPEDGLTGKTDEENFGFSYAILDEYIRTGKCADEGVKAKIDLMYANSRFKFEPMPCYEPNSSSV